MISAADKDMLLEKVNCHADVYVTVDATKMNIQTILKLLNELVPVLSRNNKQALVLVNPFLNETSANALCSAAEACKSIRIGYVLSDLRFHEARQTLQVFKHNNVPLRVVVDFANTSYETLVQLLPQTEKAHNDLNIVFMITDKPDEEFFKNTVWLCRSYNIKPKILREPTDLAWLYESPHYKFYKRHIEDVV